MKKQIFFRADGNKVIGFGHIYRLIALSQMLKDDFNCKFVVSAPDNFIRTEIGLLGLELISLPPLTYISPNEKKPKDEVPFDLENIISENDIVVTDGYWFGENYQRAVKQIGAKLFCIDDLAEHHFVADAVINHAEGVKSENYSLEPGTRLLTGYNFLLLRPEFFIPIMRKNHTSIDSVLITMGGADTFSLNYLFTEIIADLNPQIEINVILPTSADELYLKKFKEKQVKHKMLSLHHRLSAEDVVKLIDKVSHAIVSASTVLLEVNARCLKPLAGYYTDNQKSIYYGAVNSGMVGGLGDLLSTELAELRNKVESYLLNSPKKLVQPDGKKIKERYIKLFNNC